jgi:para-nitrobenzyl esterase
MTTMNRRQLLQSSLILGTTSARAVCADKTETHAPVAETRYGKVRGSQVDGVSIFRGIPYGGPTEGANRFLAPSKPAPWSGIRDATETGPRCIQGSGNLFLSPVIGEYFRGSQSRTELTKQTDSENCLGVNILTPGLRGKRPVMVYIHGGGYTGGSSLLTLFADAFPREQDVVLVGVNHRLNVFGYLYLGELSEKYATGNAGQLDLIAALEWVRDNIANFGGDPGNVTIFGESGGGAKISTLLAMPNAKGLFHKAIVESGSQLRVNERQQATATAKTILGKLGLNESRLEELHKIPAETLLGASTQTPGEAGAMRLGPVIDGRSVPEQTWDPKAPAPSAGIPMIIGCCKDESTLFSRDQSLFNLDEAGLRDRVLKAGIPATDAGTLLEAYHREHPKESPSDLYFRFSTDRGARWNAAKQAELKLEQGRANVYVYYFAWNTPCGEGKLRAFHTAELPLAMRLVRYPEAEELSKQISGAWAAFARNGRPDHAGLPKWRPYSTRQRATMIFDAGRTEVVDDPDAETRALLAKYPSRGLL